MQGKDHTTAQKRFSAVMTTGSILSAILVVWIHAYNVAVYHTVANASVFWMEQAVSQGLARGAVPFFFMSSAFFLYSKDKTVADVYKSRAKSIVVPYLLWNAVYMIAFAVLLRLSLTGSGMESVTVGNVLGGVFAHKYNYSFWFMQYLIVYVAAYPVIRWIISRNKAVAMIGLLVSLALFWSGLDLLERFAYYYIGAIVGYYYRQEAENVVLMKKKKIIGITLVLFLLEVALFFMTNVLGFGWLMRIRDLVMAFLFFFLILCCNLRITGKFAAFSFMIYALHPLILEMVEKSVYLLLPHTVLWMLTSYIMAPVICIAIVCLVCILWKKLLPSVYKVFNGGRL